MAHPSEHIGNLSMRPAHDVMALSRLGCHYPTRLSFMRVLTRTMLNEQWTIEQQTCRLDDNGVGDILYTVRTPNGLYTFVAFTHELDPDNRTDRVIAEQWDLTATLCEGAVDAQHLEKLRQNVPLQEQGRLDCRSLVLTRANQSSRNFSYVVDCLSKGLQPDADAIAKVGYLYRTTAVYGSGNVGMCDWKKIRAHHTDLNRPFAAEMLACFLLRQISFDVVEHIAKRRAPNQAVSLAPAVKRYFGIGNATGLGMAPFLICHPLLINQWVECRELALARVRAKGNVDAYVAPLVTLINRAQKHLSEITSKNEPQTAINEQTSAELNRILEHLNSYDEPTWDCLLKKSKNLSLESQEIIVSCLIELYPELVDDLADSMVADESFDIRPEQSLVALKTLLETHYSWALAIDFDKPDSRRMFWYRSAEKMEPRLGEVNVDSGADRQMHVDIALQASELYDYVCEYLQRHPTDRVAHFLISLPLLRYIVRRVQTMSQTSYGEIRTNLRDANIEPTQLMRCKLSFFGVSKFDPQSRLWVRNTMFQGAPILDDLKAASANSDNGSDNLCKHLDDWSFPVRPSV